MHGYGPFIWSRRIHKEKEKEKEGKSVEGCVLQRTARLLRTINDIGPWFSRRSDRRFLPGLSSPASLPRPVLPPSAIQSHPPCVFHLLSFLFFPFLFFLRPQRRQVGIRAAVNSPAPLSALMSLLLFALLNAIRAYSVSLPPLLEPSAITSSFQLPRKRTVVTRTRARISEIFSRSRIPQQVHTNTRARYTDGRLTRGIASWGRRGHSNQPQTCIRALLCNF